MIGSMVETGPDVGAARPSGRPLSEANFIRIAENGFGDPANVYCHGMGWYRGKLFVGTTRNTLCGAVPYDRAKWLQVWPVKNPDMIWDVDWRSQIWRFDPETGELKNVYVSPMVMGSRQFEIALISGIRDMVPFKGRSDAAEALYAVAWGSHMGPGPQILRSGDGAKFDCTPLDENVIFGGATKGLRPLVAMGDRLLVANVGTVSRSDPDQRGGGVFVSEDPASGEWAAANEDSFGDPRNVTIFEMCTWNGFVYAGTMNPYAGFELWKTDAEGKPPLRWRKVLGHGAYRGPLNELVISLCPFRDALYVGTAIYNCGYDRIYHIGPGAPEILRVRSDDSWDLVMGEARETPDGLKVPTSGLGPGFNNFMAGYIWRICEHDGWLYASTAVWTPWMGFSNPPGGGENLARFFDECLHNDEFMEKFGGFDLWRSKDGDHWTPVCRNGLSNRYNVGARTMVSTPYGLFLGTCTQFGPMVAKRRAAGWRYEPNERGAAELHLGRHEPLPAPVRLVPIEPPPRWKREPPPSVALHGSSSLIDDFYERSGWRAVGYWVAGMTSARQACENLMEELYAFARPDEPLTQPQHPTPERFDDWIANRPPRPWDFSPAVQAPGPLSERVLDLSCRFGESTNYLVKYFLRDGIVGLGASREEIRACRRRFPELRFERSKLPRVQMSGDLFDKVFCVEGLSAGVDRETLLAEINRVLAPGGRFIGSDMLVLGAEGSSAEVDHEELLREAGFEDIRVVDGTAACAHRFRDRILAFLDSMSFRIDQDERALKEALKELPGAGAAISRYLLLSARKPGTKD